jgi:membrane associated rhomboid family serine protease
MKIIHTKIVNRGFVNRLYIYKNTSTYTQNTIFVAMITYAILALTVLVSALAMENATLKNQLMFNPYQIKHQREWYRFITSGFIHADWMHLAFNMYSLYLFGNGVELFYGLVFADKATLFYILLYIGGLIFSSLYEYERHKDNPYYNALGASGAVSAVVFAYIIMAPTQKFGLLFLPGIDIPAYIFGAIFLGVEYYLGKKGNTNIGHNAHFWGAIHGAVFTAVLKPELIPSFIQQVFGQ